MKKKSANKLALNSESIRALTDLDLSRAHGGDPGAETDISGERCSVVYWCQSNTSIQRSCSSC
ncbi:MAG TPA: hypothetical protein VJU58_13885 [Microbacterium sp.]|nr:hypothetical protein [Microbacterium sp.]